MSASNKEWQRVTTNDIKWQLVRASGKTNENGTIHIEQWMIAIFFCDRFKGFMAAIRVVK